MKYKYADFIVEIAPYSDKTLDIHSVAYKVDTDACDLKIDISKEDIDFEYNVTLEKEFFKNQKEKLHVPAVQRKLAEWLPLNNAFLLHSALFDVDGCGIVFAAPSGIGKTTHMLLWQKLLGDKMVVVNGDKPIFRFFDENPNVAYGYGSPWPGKELLGCNMRTPIKHICFIKRSEVNFVKRLTKEDSVNMIFQQVYMPKNPVAMMNTISLVDRLISSVSIWEIHCNMEEQAAKIAYSTILGGL